jgi:hypothetical protein
VRPVQGQARFTVGAAALTWFVTLMVAFGVTLTVAILTGQADTPADELPGWMTAVSVTALWIPVLIGLRILSRRLGTGDFRDPARRPDATRRARARLLAAALMVP